MVAADKFAGVTFWSDSEESTSCREQSIRRMNKSTWLWNQSPTSTKLQNGGPKNPLVLLQGTVITIQELYPFMLLLARQQRVQLSPTLVALYK